MHPVHRFVSRFLLVVGLAALATACDSGAAIAPDARPGSPGAACSNSGDCDHSNCEDGHCVDPCAGVPHGDHCESYGEPIACCSADSICCSDGFEHASCHPAAQGCPQVCPRSFSGTCARDQICAYEPDPYNQTGMCQWSERVTCVDSCPPQEACAAPGAIPMCCHSGTTCLGGCCVTIPTAGADAGPPDAAPAPDAA